MSTPRQVSIDPLFDPRTLGLLVRDAPDAIIIVDGGGIIRYANAAVLDVLGHDPEALIGAGLELLVPEAKRAAHDGHVQAFQASPVARPMGIGLDLWARCRDGTELPVDIALIPLRTHEGHVAALIRDSSLHHRLVERLAASHRLVNAMLGGLDEDATLNLGASLAGGLLRAATCCIALLEPHGRQLEIRAVHGAHADRLLGQSGPVEQSLVWSDNPAGVLLIDDLHSAALSFPEMAGLPLGPVLVVRIGHGRDMLGSITFARARGASPFDDTDREIAVQFADSLSVALMLAETRESRENLARMTERDRIARDLHDTVIQHIFGVAMRLESAMQVADGPAAERIDEAVKSLDEVIRDIRTTIFGLQHPHQDTQGVRGLLLREVDQAAGLLGFMPRLAFVGPVEMLVSTPLARTVVNVLREALSNIVRHAGAHEVEVILEVGDDLCLTVVDDGVGPSNEPTAGRGLANLEDRALSQGGQFSMYGRHTGGTRLRWRVPLGEDTR